jgi:hypothetical protein
LEHNFNEDYQNFGGFGPFLVGHLSFPRSPCRLWPFNSPQPFDAVSLVLNGTPFNAFFSFYVDKTRFTANLEKVLSFFIFFCCSYEMIFAHLGWTSRDFIHTFQYGPWNRSFCRERRRGAGNHPCYKPTNPWGCCDTGRLYRKLFCVLENKKDLGASIREGFEQSQLG